MARIVKIVLLLSLFLGGTVKAQSLEKQKNDSLKKLSVADQQQMLKTLNINKLRPAPNFNPTAQNAANFDESKADPYPDLPPVLTLHNGRKVNNPKLWWSERRPEIVELFDREIYGRVPANIPQVSWRVIKIVNGVSGNVPTITKTLIGHVDNSAFPAINVDIQLTLTLPGVAKPVPVIMELSFPEDYGRNSPSTGTIPGWQQQVLSKGWGYAMLLPISIQADNGAGLTQGIIGLVNKGQSRKPDDWGALRAWAWGASRAMDYLVTDRMVNACQVGLEGHSRYGKTALVAMAYDQRFAIVYCSSSGEGGAKLHRRNLGEQVENIASAGAYHWMAGNFLKYAGPIPVKDMPVDAHELISLSAPRPVFIGAGANGDDWTDPHGMFMAEVATGAVYRLLGKKPLETSVYPMVGTSLINGDLAFRLHEGGHTPVPNWPAFLEFAGKYWE